MKYIIKVFHNSFYFKLCIYLIQSACLKHHYVIALDY